MRFRRSGAILTLAALSAIVGLSEPPVQESQAAFPGTNGKIAFVRQVDPGWGEIFVMNLDGSNQVRISNDPGFDESPAWSADGSKLAFSRRPRGGGPADIWIMDADGANQTNVTNSGNNNETLPSWSPKGDRLVFAADSTLKVIALADSAVTDLGVSGQSPAWSADGGRIAFSDGGIPTLRVMNADGSNPVSIAEPHSTYHNPNWSPNGKALAVSGIGPLAGPVKVIDECGENGYLVPLPPSSSAWEAAWSPDGSKLVIGADNSLITLNVDGSGQQLIAGDVYFGGVDWQAIAETLPEPQPRPHTCTGLVATVTPSPLPETPPAPPILLPRPGGPAKDGSFAIVPVAAMLFAIVAVACAIALIQVRR
jgi:dipeptidyl aminopeptidase/acylaminoacyl peptidase